MSIRPKEKCVVPVEMGAMQEPKAQRVCNLQIHPVAGSGSPSRKSRSRSSPRRQRTSNTPEAVPKKSNGSSYFVPVHLTPRDQGIALENERPGQLMENDRDMNQQKQRKTKILTKNLGSVSIKNGDSNHRCFGALFSTPRSVEICGH